MKRDIFAHICYLSYWMIIPINFQWMFNGCTIRFEIMNYRGIVMNLTMKLATIAALVCVVAASCMLFAESSDAADYETATQDAITYKLLPAVEGGGGEHS